MADMIMIDKDDLNWALVTLNYLNNNDGDISEQEPEIHEEIRREIERMSKKYISLMTVLVKQLMKYLHHLMTDQKR